MSGAKIIEGLKQAAEGGFDRVTINGQRWRRERQREPAVLLSGRMKPEEIAAAMDQMVFTAARDWVRTISFDRDVRDIIVRSLKS